MGDWHRIEHLLLRELYAFISNTLGGKISGEHGIGLKRKEYLRELMPENEYDLMLAIKRAIDPKGIMNPGKIFSLTEKRTDR